MAPGKRSSGAWYGEDRSRVLFERGLRKAYPGVRRRFVKNREDAGLWYVGTVPVDGYSPRKIEVRFPKGLTAESVRVFADGPDRSPHRFANGSLCIWYGDDPEERRWVRSDGIVALLDLVVVHLFKEAYWRETDEWLGDEAPHGTTKPRPRPRRIRRAR